MDSADDLAALIRAEVTRQLASQQTQIMIVDSLQENGLVNLRWGDGAIINGVAANQSYNPRAEGDVVMVQQSAAGWRVIDKIGAPNTPQTPQGVQLTFGPNQPTGSWVQGVTTWVGENQLHIQTGPGPGGPTDPPNASKPKPASIDPDDRAGYRDGRRDGDRVAQGCWHSYPHPYTGVWTYGTAIADACSGKTVASMQVRVARTSKNHGVSGKVKPRLGLHSNTTPPAKTPSLSDRWDGPGLGLGDSKWVTIPTSAAAKLASGTARGIGISAGTGDSAYMICTDGCGDLKISFSA